MASEPTTGQRLVWPGTGGNYKEVEIMSEVLLQRIDELDDRTAIRMLEFYSARVFEGMETTPEEMLDSIPEEFKDRVPFEFVLEMSNKERSRPLPEDESVVLARELLRGFARDPAFAPSLVEAMDEYQDDTLLAGAILATGIAVSMIIIAATTTFKGKVGNFEVAKETADASIIEALLKHFPQFG